MSRRHRSLLMLVSSMVIYGTIGIFRRLIPVSSGVLACSRGIIVNFDKIRRFTDSVLSMQNGDTVPVSRRRLREVKDAYAEYVFLK